MKINTEFGVRKYQFNMEFGVYTQFGMANLNMDRNCHIDALIIRSYEGNISLTWKFGVYTQFGMADLNMDRN